MAYSITHILIINRQARSASTSPIMLEELWPERIHRTGNIGQCFRAEVRSHCFNLVRLALWAETSAVRSLSRFHFAIVPEVSPLATWCGGWGGEKPPATRFAVFYHLTSKSTRHDGSSLKKQIKVEYGPFELSMFIPITRHFCMCFCSNVWEAKSCIISCRLSFSTSLKP